MALVEGVLPFRFSENWQVEIGMSSAFLKVPGTMKPEISKKVYDTSAILTKNRT